MSSKLFITGIKGTTLSFEEKLFLQSHEVAGILLFSKNITDAKQLEQLINEIQSLRRDYPFIISIDHEGGRVQRNKELFTHFPSMKIVGDYHSPKLVFDIHQQMAEELSYFGINLNFSPVADVLLPTTHNAIGDRSFGSDSILVANCVSAAIRGLETNAVMSCVKHFPGHGMVNFDTHIDQGITLKKIEEIEKFEMVPFIRAVKSKTAMIMVGHFISAAFNPSLPCSLSPEVYRYIKTVLKSKSVLITDDMEMDAILKCFTLPEAIILAFNHGADLAIVRNFDNLPQLVDEVDRKMEQDKNFKMEINKKVNRVEALKKKYLSTYRPVKFDMDYHYKLLSNGHLLKELMLKADFSSFNKS